MLLFFIFFCFKQKTAYELRISDWSSDVCSSDLFRSRPGRVDCYLERVLESETGLGVVLGLSFRAARGFGEINYLLGSFYTCGSAGYLMEIAWSFAVALRELRARDAAETRSQNLRSEAHTSELQSLMRTSYDGLLW